MSERGRGGYGRRAGHAIVEHLSEQSGVEIARDPNLTDDQKLAAQIGRTGLEFLGHLAVDLAADWWDERDDADD